MAWRTSALDGSRCRSSRWGRGQIDTSRLQVREGRGDPGIVVAFTIAPFVAVVDVAAAVSTIIVGVVAFLHLLLLLPLLLLLLLSTCNSIYSCCWQLLFSPPSSSDDRLVEYGLRWPLLLERRSRFQLIQIGETEDHGRVLILDGLVNLAESDTEAYTNAIMGLPEVR